MKYVNVVLPLALPKLLTYAVPAEWEHESLVGKRVAVQMGKRKLYAAIVHSEHRQCPPYAVKPILLIIDDQPIVYPLQLQLWDWIAQYYMCAQGEVMKAALPAALKMESETKVQFNTGWSDFQSLTNSEQQLVRILQSKKEVSIDELLAQAQDNKAMAMVKQLLEKGAVVVEEQLNNPFKPKTEWHIRLHPRCKSEDDVQQLFAAVARSAKQEQLLLAYLSMAIPIQFESPLLVSRQLLLDKAGVSLSVLKACIDKQILVAIQQEVTRLDDYNTRNTPTIPLLSEEQHAAYTQIKQGFEHKQVILLHGVTSSGKTEIYISLINDAIEQHQQVLYLLPEIALTAQLVNRLTKVFGNKVAVYHSKFSDAQRAEVYRSLLDSNHPVQIILGVRSSVFLPFSRLGLIIIDEEHESTYKQYDPAPRYHARDVAIVMAHMHGAKVLLGSATPSIESYHNALQGKYNLVELHTRYGNASMPTIRLVDVSHIRRKKEPSHFSPVLTKEIEQRLSKQEQVILFQNRRGFSPFVECRECGWVPQCKYCNVSLTYHKHNNQLVCHYCGYTMGMPGSCLACGTSDMATKGFGTEKIEEELQLLFPNSVVERMDLDTTRSRSAYERIISDFEHRRIQILVGTQMVTKGLDFEAVTLVAVLNADNLLAYPDFRAGERSFQLISQVAGRAGRRDKEGLVLVQTGMPRHPILAQVVHNDYRGMYHQQVAERQAFLYPPFTRLIKISLKHKDDRILFRAVAMLTPLLKQQFGEWVLGPEMPLINRVQNRYIINYLLKIERGRSTDKIKEVLTNIFGTLQNDPQIKSISIIPDVDPY